MSQILDPGSSAKKLGDFLRTLSKSGLDLKSQILACNGQVQPTSSDPAGATSLASIPADSATTSPQTSTCPDTKVELTGPDPPLLLAHNGELLHAIEHVAAKILRLEPEDHDRISFDADGFKANRDRELELMAEIAVQKVRATGQSHAFSPMTSRERRMLHVALAKSGLPTASSGEGPGRFVVVYPESFRPAPAAAPSAEDRTRAIRDSFR